MNKIQSKIQHNLVLSLTLMLTLTIFVQCNRVPLTKRRQVSLLSESNMLSMSTEQYQEVISTSPVITEGANALMVKNVGQKIAVSVESFLKDNGYEDRLQYFEWEFNLIDNEQINAWCMPGGKVCFYTGILPLTQDENGLAVVMGHEIAHAVARHGNERMSQGMIVSFGGMALDVALSQKPEATRNLFLSAYGAGAQVGVVLPFSRKNELEADQLGLVFMHLAGYDVNKAADFWVRMSQNGGSVPEFMSTHPSDERRINEINKFINSKEFKKY